ncbi:hypothetical protein EV363DRAFT_1421604 [Boletus edulis]|nr:hypothetical protein EV363DRAFT_1421604 [Boletus edulis]
MASVPSNDPSFADLITVQMLESIRTTRTLGNFKQIRSQGQHTRTQLLDIQTYQTNKRRNKRRTFMETIKSSATTGDKSSVNARTVRGTYHPTNMGDELLYSTWTEFGNSRTELAICNVSMEVGNAQREMSEERQGGAVLPEQRRGGCIRASLKAYDTATPVGGHLKEGVPTPGRSVSGSSLSKGVAPTVPIIIASLTTGNNEECENAAYAISDLVERTDKSAIKPFVVPFSTGPLIRVVTQATTFPPGFKTAILSALTLQQTFVKSVSDPSSIVMCMRAVDVLGVLMRNQPCVDPVDPELVGGARGSKEEIAASYVLAMAHVIESSAVHGGVGDKIINTGFVCSTRSLGYRRKTENAGIQCGVGGDARKRCATDIVTERVLEGGKDGGELDLGGMIEGGVGGHSSMGEVKVEFGTIMRQLPIRTHKKSEKNRVGVDWMKSPVPIVQPYITALPTDGSVIQSCIPEIFTKYAFPHLPHIPQLLRHTVHGMSWCLIFRILSYNLSYEAPHVQRPKGGSARPIDRRHLRVFGATQHFDQISTHIDARLSGFPYTSDELSAIPDTPSV